MIRLLIVDDSPLVSKILSDIFNKDPQLIVAGVARNGREAVELVPKIKPDLVTMDVNMPEVDGCEATKRIMAYHPVPILILSSSAFKSGAELAFKSLAYGALDVFEKGLFESGGQTESARALLIERVKLLARVKVISHPLGRIEKGGRQKAEGGRISLPATVPGGAENRKIIAIAASTGGPQALMTVLKTLPKDFPCGIVIVQHITPGFAEGLAEWLDKESCFSVRLAQDSAVIRPATAYVAPTGAHMRVAGGGVIRLSDEAPFDGQKPSANLLFDSVAKVYRDRAVGIILTGMGSDGALGAKQIHECGGKVIVQDEASSVIFGMPKTAIEMGIADEVVSLDRIPEALAGAVFSNKIGVFHG